MLTVSSPSESSIVRSSTLVRPCLELFLFVPRSFLPEFILLSCDHSWSAFSSCFTLAVTMREVYCVGYTPRAWDPRTLQSILDGPLYFEAKGLNGRNVATERPFLSVIEQ